MRSTQFDEHSPFEEKPEEHRRRTRPDSLCEIIKCLGYARNNQVRAYGEVFELVSDPIRIGDNLWFVNALEQKSGHFMRVMIPQTIVHKAKNVNRAA